MPPSRNIDSWQLVDSRQDFAAFLRFLSFDCGHPRSGTDCETPEAQQWVHTSIQGFLWGWVGLLGRRHNGKDLLHEEAPGRPGWRGLAYQLDTVRTSSPGYNCILADSGLTNPEEVDNPNDMRMYAATLAMAFPRDPRERQAKIEGREWAGDGETWAHSTLHGWLASWAAWVGTNSPMHAQLDPVTWRSVALQLSIARLYEQPSTARSPETIGRSVQIA